MERSRFTEEQIIDILKEHEAGDSVGDLCRKHRVSDATIYKWKAKYGGMEVSEVRRLKGLEDEKARPKRLLVNAMPDDAALKDLFGQQWRRPPQSGKRSRIWWQVSKWAKQKSRVLLTLDKKLGATSSLREGGDHPTKARITG